MFKYGQGGALLFRARIRLAIEALGQSGWAERWRGRIFVEDDLRVVNRVGAYAIE